MEIGKWEVEWKGMGVRRKYLFCKSGELNGMLTLLVRDVIRPILTYLKPPGGWQSLPSIKLSHIHFNTHLTLSKSKDLHAVYIYNTLMSY